jgi:mannose-6-phosphate isomerase
VIKELSPTLIRKIWGGNKLEKMKGLVIAPQEILDPVGETLEIFEKNLPYIAKFIDTSDELSIQVHPTDQYAHIHENSSGKTECWIILEADDESGIYLGLKSHVTKDLLKRNLEKKSNVNFLIFILLKKEISFIFRPEVYTQ